ncbi:MAG TPA: AI-2E family transporter [Longimicrobium sp.]|jgi:predicted PurR-regulated permease PerM
MPGQERRLAATERSPYAVLTATVFTVLLLLFVYSVAEVLLLVFLAALFAVYLTAISEFLEDRFRIRPALGLPLALLFSAVWATGVFWLVIPPVLQQTQELIAALPKLMSQGVDRLTEVVSRYPFLAAALPPAELQKQVSTMMSSAGGYFAGLVPYLFGTLHVLINGISVLVMGMYMALRPGLYREGIISLTPPVHRELVRDILADLGRSLRAWIGGQILAMFFLGALTYVGLLLLDVPFALAFGVFTGVVVMVPFFGTLVSTLLPALFVLGSGGLGRAFLVVLLGVVIHIVEANFIHPLIMERRVHLPPVLSILSVLIMAELMGMVGLLVAVPVLATVMVIVRRIYVHRLLEGKGFRRFVRDSPAEIRLPERVLRLPAGSVSIPAILEEAGAAPR